MTERRITQPASRFNRFMEGVRVLDLSAYIPGPLAGLLLADMGADVLKIEPPAGDGMRELGPRDAAGEPVFHAAINAGKTICRLDLKSAAGRDALLQLVRDADVLIEGFRPGVMDRLGVGYPVLASHNPALVYCAISGYGASGPYAARAGHDANYLAEAGVLPRNGVPPRYFDPPVTDLGGALFAVIAMLGALRQRERIGRGCQIDLALADTPMLLQQFAIAGFGAGEPVPASDESYLNGGAAFYRLYPTRDGRYVALGAVEPKFWQAFCAAAERPDWRARHADPLPQTALIAELDSYFKTHSLAQCEARFGPADCCFSAVLALPEALQSPHHRARDLLRRGPRDQLQALFPAWVDGLPPATRQAAHTSQMPKFGARVGSIRNKASH